MPHADLFSLMLPVLLTLAAGCATLVAEPFLHKSDAKHAWLPWIGAVILVLAGMVLAFAPTGELNGLYALDDARRWLLAAILGATVISLGGLQQTLSRDRFPGGEAYALACFGAAGAMLMVMASNFLGLFVALEVMSLAIYALVGLRRHDKASNEALLKYFIMGAVFSAVLVYGMALIYGATGSIAYGAPALAGREHLWMLGHGLVIVALLFKVGVVPFHFWSPDAYAGAPAAVTGYMGAVVKVGGFAALGALWLNMVAAVSGTHPGGVLALDAAITVSSDGARFLRVFTTLFMLLALMSILIGNFSALRQTSTRRMIAFSSVAQAGYMLMALVLPLSRVDEVVSLGALWLYLVGYAIATAGALAVIAAMAGREDRGDDLAGLSGQGRVQPFLGLCLTVFVAGFAGLPPVAGFFGKFLIFADLVNKGQILIAVIALVLAVVAAGYYLKLIISVWSGKTTEAAEPGDQVLVRWALAAGAIATLLVAVRPDALSRPSTPDAPHATAQR
jgi:NADH-quinone oxidoreductase subunit N